MLINQNPGQFGFQAGGCGRGNPLQFVFQLLQHLLSGLLGNQCGNQGGGSPCSGRGNFGGCGGGGGGHHGGGGCRAMNDNLGAFLGGGAAARNGHGQFAAAGFAAGGKTENGQWAAAGFVAAGRTGGHGHAQGGDVKRSEGNPDKWYFEHGKYQTTKTENGHVQTDGKTRVEYNKETKTGHVYGMVAGAWQLQEVRSNWEGKAASPIMLDMDGNNRPDVKNGEWKPHAEKGDIGAQKARFDLNGDGQKELTEWTGGKDGLLLKLNDEQMKSYGEKGKLEVSGKELYGDEGGKYADGYEKMRKTSDANGDGKLSGDELNNHYVWQDANRDAVVDKGELKSTEKAGITSVNATHNGDYQSSFEMNGEQRKSWDWWPTTW